MKYKDLRDFLTGLDGRNELMRVREPVSPVLEMTALSDAVLRASGPALLFERPGDSQVTALTNLFGTTRRVALGMGANDVTELREVGRVLASLKEPEPPAGLKDAGRLLQVPASAEIVLEGHIPACAPGFSGASEHGVAWKEIGGYLHALEGPFGDHTGYYNEQEWFPVFEITRLTHRRSPIYHSTYTGKPPDEPAVLGVALNEVFVPILQKQFPEIADFYLPPEGCSYRMAIISMRKAYPGHAKRVMFGVWSFLRQFMYTKFIVVTDDDVDIRSWPDVIWAITTRVDPVRDTTLVAQTPIDYLDFASPVSGLGGKLGLDATHKWPGETDRQWGRAITMPAAVRQRVDGLLATILKASKSP